MIKVAIASDSPTEVEDFTNWLKKFYKVQADNMIYNNRVHTQVLTVKRPGPEPEPEPEARNKVGRPSKQVVITPSIAQEAGCILRLIKKLTGEELLIRPQGRPSEQNTRARRAAYCLFIYRLKLDDTTSAELLGRATATPAWRQRLWLQSHGIGLSAYMWELPLEQAVAEVLREIGRY